jgi:hypothetical protein
MMRWLARGETVLTDMLLFLPWLGLLSQLLRADGTSID